jgi:HflK protein
MPMNEQPPWGKRKKPTGPEDFLANLIQKIRDTFSRQDEGGAPRGDQKPPSSDEAPNLFAGIGKILVIVAAVFLLQGVFTCFYTIKPGEVGVILRFGQYTRTTQPGLHFKIPFMEDLAKVDVETIRKEEFGFRSRNSGAGASSSFNKGSFERKGYDMESLMLTGDKDVIEVAWIVQYKVNDPVRFLFKVRDVAQAVRDASETVTRRIVGNMDFDYVLGNRDVLAANAKRELQAQMNRLECGIDILTLQLLDINPPEHVKPAFNEVNEADQDMKRLVNEAEETYNRVIPKARGSAKQIVEEAHGYAAERVNRATGETNRFKAIVKEYQAAEEITRQRLYLEAMEDILPNVDHVYVINKNLQNILPLFDLTNTSAKQSQSGAK